MIDGGLPEARGRARVQGRPFSRNEESGRVRARARRVCVPGGNYEIWAERAAIGEISTV